ncbi:MAG: integrase catalytic domain-containing protein [Candidatus Methylomirabilales bacterium]
MSPRSIREYAEAVRPTYGTARKREKTRILTEFCRVTGYHRKSAVRLLHRQPAAKPTRRGRPPRYTAPIARALLQVWEAAGQVCSKRLAPFLPELLPVLERHGEIRLPPPVRQALLRISAPTIDRLLRPLRPKSLRQPHGATRAAPTLLQHIPIRTFGEWRHVPPGSFQADLVLHCGDSLAGFHLTTLIAVDVATGWTECLPVWGQGYQRVGTAVHRLRQRLPFPLRELHTDNGGEFLNSILYPWCQREGIRFTRGRPYKKNDQAYAEQKVWAIVRRLVGYDRYSTRAAFDQLDRLYELLRLYTNFFQPTAKLRSKTRRGPRLIKRFDPARTPYQRLLHAGVLASDQGQTLQSLFLSLNPVQLRKAIEGTLDGLWKLSDQHRR